jgi:GT2 family glycosyltransferase
MIDVILPVIRQKDAELLLEDMDANTRPPDRVILIDNTAEVFRSKIVPRVPVLYIRPSKRLGVNASWNIGMALAGAEYVSFLNDDIRISPRFFEGIEDVFQYRPHVGVVCPKTVGDIDAVGYDGSVPNDAMSRREGWAFTVRRALLRAIPPIPESLEIFCGDDWIWHHTRIRSGVWVKQNGNVIYHRPGASASPEYRAALKREKAVFEKIIMGGA